MDQDFELEKRDVSTAELDALIKEYKETYDEYEKQKAISTELFHKAEGLENRLTELLVMAGKTKYECEGVALVSIGHKASVTTPKTLEEKEKFFNFLENKFGHEGLMAYLSVNSATLNALYNKELVEASDKGIEFEMGKVLALPTLKRTLSVRKK